MRQLLALLLNDPPSPLTYIAIAVVASVVSSILVQAIGQVVASNVYARVQRDHETKLAQHDSDIQMLRDTLIRLGTVCELKFAANADPAAASAIGEALETLNIHISTKGG